MGFHLVSRVYSEITNTAPTEQAILAYLAFRADDASGSCFPSRDTIAAATHFGQSAISNGLNGLREKNILKWVKGGRKAKGRGFSASNEYSFNFPQLSTKLSTSPSSEKPSTDTICREATYAYAARRQLHMPRGGNCICRETATIIKDHNINQPSVIKGPPSGPGPMEEVLRKGSIEIGREWAQSHQRAPQPEENLSPLQRAMRVCGVTDKDNYCVFYSIMKNKSLSRCDDVIRAFESEIRQGEHEGLKNRAALLTARLKQLPDR